MPPREVEKKILEVGPDNVAAFIGEPIQGAAGVIIPPPNYWPEVERICRKYGILLVADEVICGFGRTGNWWGFETMGFNPDIVRDGQGIVVGLPADRRHGGVGRDHRRVLRQGRRVLPRLHLFRASGGLCGCAREHPHPRG